MNKPLHKVGPIGKLTHDGCVFCGSTEFTSFAGRPVAKCARCGSLERTRVMGLVLLSNKLLKPGLKILHFAPEKCLHDLIVGSQPAEYIKADIRTSVQGMEVTHFDIVEQIASLKDKSFDLIIHNHVLEHLRCSDIYVLFHMHRALTDSGWHLFSIPIWPGKHFKADFNEHDPNVLEARFGQKDHVALYGTEGFEKGLGAALGVSADYDLETIVSRELLDSNKIPLSFRKGLNGSSVIMTNRRSWRYGRL